jgi:hypothetical protein
MLNILLSMPVVHFYLVFVGVLLAAALWTREGPPPPVPRPVSLSVAQRRYVSTSWRRAVRLSLLPRQRQVTACRHENRRP